jgi:hypothetical protein
MNIFGAVFMLYLENYFDTKWLVILCHFSSPSSRGGEFLTCMI